MCENWKNKRDGRYSCAHHQIASCKLEGAQGAAFSLTRSNSHAGDSRELITVNTKNKGCITDLDSDVVVEVTSMITAYGPEPFAWGSFAPIAKGLLQNLKEMEILTVEAALEGNYEKLVQAFVLCPLITSGGKAIEMLHEMLVANKKYLPNFAEKIKEIEAGKE